MRPTLSEYLGGLRRIIEESIAPSVQGEYANEMLAGVLRSLAMLEENWPAAPDFLVWDNTETARLLAAIEPHVPLGGPVRPLTAPTTFAELDAENERLRALLASAIPALAARPAASAVYSDVVAHLRTRIDRYPHRSTGTLPAR